LGNDVVERNVAFFKKLLDGLNENLKAS